MYARKQPLQLCVLCEGVCARQLWLYWASAISMGGGVGWLGLGGRWGGSACWNTTRTALRQSVVTFLQCWKIYSQILTRWEQTNIWEFFYRFGGHWLLMLVSLLDDCLCRDQAIGNRQLNSYIMDIWKWSNGERSYMNVSSSGEKIFPLA